MNLYAIRLTLDLVICATDEEQAKKLATDVNIHRDERRHMELTDTRRIVGPADLPAKWDAGCLPYGRQDDVTIGEIMGVTHGTD